MRPDGAGRVLPRHLANSSFATVDARRSIIGARASSPVTATVRCAPSPHGAPRSANAMTTGSDTDAHGDIDIERALEIERFLTPGRWAGRYVDGCDLIIDGKPAGRMPPRWVDQLTHRGYQPARDGPIAFTTTVLDRVETFPDVRSALAAARHAVEAGTNAWDVQVDAVTATGLRVMVVTGTPVVGMAIGAIEDPPITVAEGPAWLPPYPPGEEPGRAARSRRRGRSRA